MLRRVPLLIALLIVAVGIAASVRDARQRRDPLGALADSAMRGKTRAPCVPSPWAGSQGVYRYGRAPFRMCRGTGADTTVWVDRDADDRTVRVWRLWPVPSHADASLDSLAAALTRRHGAPHVCTSEEAGPRVRTSQWWDLHGEHIRLTLLPYGDADALELSVQLGVPTCGTAAR